MLHAELLNTLRGERVTTLNAGTFVIHIKYNPTSLAGFQFGGDPVSRTDTFTTSLNGTADWPGRARSR